MQNRLTVRLFGISSVKEFIERVERCQDQVFLDFDDTRYNVKENKRLRDMLSAMAVDDRLYAVLPVSVTERDLPNIMALMQKRAA